MSSSAVSDLSLLLLAFLCLTEAWLKDSEAVVGLDPLGLGLFLRLRTLLVEGGGDNPVDSFFISRDSEVSSNFLKNSCDFSSFPFTSKDCFELFGKTILSDFAVGIPSSFENGFIKAWAVFGNENVAVFSTFAVSFISLDKWLSTGAGIFFDAEKLVGLECTFSDEKNLKSGNVGISGNDALLKVGEIWDSRSKFEFSFGLWISGKISLLYWTASAGFL